MKRQSVPAPFPKLPASHTLESTVAYRDELTDLYYEDICISRMKGRAIPASLREVAPLDPRCAGCGISILGQSTLWWGNELLRREQEVQG
jgi:hypothetical protein